MMEPVYVPYEQYRAAKTRCGLDSRIYGIYVFGFKSYIMTCKVYKIPKTINDVLKLDSLVFI
jgi:hypothetical protein